MVVDFGLLQGPILITSAGSPSLVANYSCVAQFSNEAVQHLAFRFPCVVHVEFSRRYQASCLGAGEMIVLSRIQAGVHAPYGLHIINALPKSRLVYHFGVGLYLYIQFSLQNAISHEQR